MTTYSVFFWAKVKSWYVKCPLHGSHRSCTKSMSEGSAGSDMTLRKLLFWLAKGILDQTKLWVMVGPGFRDYALFINESIVNGNIFLAGRQVVSRNTPK